MQSIRQSAKKASPNCETLKISRFSDARLFVSPQADNAEFRSQRLNTGRSKNDGGRERLVLGQAATGGKPLISRVSTGWPVSQCREQRATLASDLRPQGLLTHRPASLAAAMQPLGGKRAFPA